MEHLYKKSYFSLFVGEDNQYYFNLRSGNHEIILNSEGYKTKANALNGIHSVQENCTIDERYERKTQVNGDPYFVLKARNCEPIGKGEGYSSIQMMEKGIDAVKRSGTTNEIKEHNAKCYTIYVNKKPFKVTLERITGEQILALVGQNSNSHSLYLIQGNTQTEVNSNETIKVKDDLQFQTVIRDIKFG